MNQKKVALNYILFYIVGNVIFNIVFSTIKTVWVNAIGGRDLWLENLFISFQETILFYTLVYVIMVMMNESYKKITVYKLNQKLNKIKEGSEEDER